MRENNYTSRPKKASDKIYLFTASLFRIATGVGLFLFVGVALVFGHDFFTQCDYFCAKNIEISGNRALNKGQVLAITKIHPGINILSVNLPLTRNRLLANPWVAEATVKRDIPANLMITIIEHDPMAIVDLGRKYVMNRQGRIFKEWEKWDQHQLPLITGLDFSDLDASGNLSGRPFQSILEIFRLNREPDCIISAHMLKKIDVDKEIGLTIHLSEPIDAIRIDSIKMGYDQYAVKYARLKQLIAHLKQYPGLQNFVSIDLNNTNRVVAHPMPAETIARGNEEV
jgi:cell division protein FtsQ